MDKRALIGVILLVEALVLGLLGHKIEEYMPLVRLIALISGVAGAVLLSSVAIKYRPTGGRSFTSGKVMNFIGLRHQEIVFPIYGIVLISGLVMYNARKDFDLGGFDGITLILGILFLVYGWIPERYGWARDFALLLFLFSFLILVLPVTAYRIVTGASDREGSTAFSAILIVRPLAFILNVIGVHAVASGGILIFRDIHGVDQRVYVALACSGFYSTAIFVSAFLALILVEYRKINMGVIIIMALGVVTAYAANLLRMIILVLMGYYNGMGDRDHPEFGTLLWGHAFLGEIIFLGWIALFWYLIYRYLMRGSPSSSPSVDSISKE